MLLGRCQRPAPDRIPTQGRERIFFFFFLPDRDVAYPEFVNIAHTLREGEEVPVGNPWPRESHLRPGGACRAASLPWVSRAEPGPGLEEVWALGGNSGPTAPAGGPSSVSGDTRLLTGQNR